MHFFCLPLCASKPSLLVSVTSRKCKHLVAFPYLWWVSFLQSYQWDPTHRSWQRAVLLTRESHAIPHKTSKQKPSFLQSALRKSSSAYESHAIRHWHRNNEGKPKRDTRHFFLSAKTPTPSLFTFQILEPWTRNRTYIDLHFFLFSKESSQKSFLLAQQSKYDQKLSKLT